MSFVSQSNYDPVYDEYALSGCSRLSIIEFSPDEESVISDLEFHGFLMMLM